MKINEAIDEYLTECEIRKYTPRTLRSYRINLNLFARWCEEEKGITEMDEIKMPTTRQFAQFMIQKGVRTKSWTMPIGRVFVYTPAD